MLQVQGSIDHISETLDVLIEGAMEQTTHESDSAKALQKVAHDMHAQEVCTKLAVLVACEAYIRTPAQIARLRTQNERLTQLLQEEQQTSTRLRNDLVSQITSLLTGFTTAQSASLNKAVSEISSVNDQSVTALNSALASYDGEADLASQRSNQYRVDLDLIRKAQTSNRADATKVCQTSWRLPLAIRILTYHTGRRRYSSWSNGLCGSQYNTSRGSTR